MQKQVVFMCGPPPMMYALSKGFHHHGLSYHQIIFEDFNMLN